MPSFCHFWVTFGDHGIAVYLVWRFEFWKWSTLTKMVSEFVTNKIHILLHYLCLSFQNVIICKLLDGICPAPFPAFCLLALAKDITAKKCSSNQLINWSRPSGMLACTSTAARCCSCGKLWYFVVLFSTVWWCGCALTSWCCKWEGLILHSEIPVVPIEIGRGCFTNCFRLWDQQWCLSEFGSAALPCVHF